MGFIYIWNHGGNYSNDKTCNEVSSGDGNQAYFELHWQKMRSVPLISDRQFTSQLSHHGST